MTGTLREEWRHARNRHCCDLCCDPIQPHDLYYVYITVDTDGFWTCRLCPTCVDIDRAYSRDAHWCMDGWTNEAVIDWAEDIAHTEPNHPAYRLAARLTTKLRYHTTKQRAELQAELGNAS